MNEWMNGWMNDMTVLTPSSYEDAFKESWLFKELHKTRNIRPSFNTSLGGGCYGGGVVAMAVWWLLWRCGGCYGGVVVAMGMWLLLWERVVVRWWFGGCCIMDFK